MSGFFEDSWQPSKMPRGILGHPSRSSARFHRTVARQRTLIPDPGERGGGSGQRGRPSILTGSQESRNAHRHYLKLKQGEKKKNKKKNKEEQGGRREVEGGGGRWREEGEGGGGGDDIGIICPP